MGTISFQELIRVPFARPSDDEFVALVTRMRMLGAWDPRYNHYVGDKRVYYSSFIRDCVGFAVSAPARVGESYHKPYPEWITASALKDLKFRSFALTSPTGGYMIAKEVWGP
jgi:hypothetical protein